MASPMSTRILPSYGEIYPFKNDPRRGKKSQYVTNVSTYTGGYIPILDDQNHAQRRPTRAYDYDDKVHRGARPMHQTSFDLNYQKNRNDFVTNNMMVISNWNKDLISIQVHNDMIFLWFEKTFRGSQVKADNLPQPGRDQFRHQFDLGFSDKRRFQTDYESNFYAKNVDRVSFLIVCLIVDTSRRYTEVPSIQKKKLF